MRGRKKKVQWNPGVVKKVAETRRIRPYFGDNEYGEGGIDPLWTHLVPGTLWRTKSRLEVETQRIGDGPMHEFPYAWPCEAIMFMPPGSRTIHADAAAIYVGDVSVEERRYDKRLRTHVPARINRHSFIIGGMRVLVTRIDLLEPLGS